MDYMREINAFYDWLETNTLSANAVLTWHALMHTNNKCFWKTEFAVAISVLAHKTGGVSRRSVERARNELQQKGLIQWRERPGCQSAMYTMLSIVRLCDAQNVAQNVAQRVAQSDAQPVAITSYPSDTRKTKTKTNTKTNTPRARASSVPALLGEHKNVLLTQEELDRLRADYPDIDAVIGWFSLYIADKGYKIKAKTHNLAIRRWVVTAYREHKAREGRVANTAGLKMPVREVSQHRYGQREYGKDDFDGLFYDVMQGGDEV